MKTPQKFVIYDLFGRGPVQSKQTGFKPSSHVRFRSKTRNANHSLKRETNARKSSRSPSRRFPPNSSLFAFSIARNFTLIPFSQGFKVLSFALCASPWLFVIGKRAGLGTRVCSVGLWRTILALACLSGDFYIGFVWSLWWILILWQIAGYWRFYDIFSLFFHCVFSYVIVLMFECLWWVFIALECFNFSPLIWIHFKP